MGHLWNIYGTFMEHILRYLWDIICNMRFMGYITAISTQQQFHRDIENGTANQQNDMWLYHALSANGRIPKVQWVRK